MAGKYNFQELPFSQYIYKVIAQKKARRMQNLKIKISILFLLNLLLFGCGTKEYNIRIDEIGTYPQPLIKPLPITVGVYFGDEFRTLKYRDESYVALRSHIFNIDFGRANIALFDYILSHAFEMVTAVQNLSEHFEEKSDIDLIIEPSLSEYFFHMFPDICVAKIAYKVTFHTRDGGVLEPWIIEGYANAASKYYDANSLAVELNQMAMRQVAAIFLTNLCERKDMKQLFYDQCGQ